MKRHIIVQVWDYGIEYSELLKRVSIEESELVEFTNAVEDKLGYSVVIEKHEVDGWLWFTETLDKIKKDRRNARRRHLYWEKKNPEEAKRRKNLMEFYFKAAGVPEPLLPSLFLKAKKNKESSGVIKFRRYKKTDER